ncbi:MAG: hypothetical protein ACE5ID_06395, partial [Acidobacteriota bacterium]
MNRDSPAVSDGRAELLDHIRKEIRQDGPLPFSRFQELALYHPEFGYYTLGAAIGEAGGDFLTAPEMGPLFGELIGLQVGEMSRILGDPAGFTLAEVGGGHGSLARALLDAWRRQNHPLYRPGV